MSDDDMLKILDKNTQSNGPTGVSIYEALFENDENEILLEAIKSLPSKQRRIIKMRYLDGATLAKIFKKVKITRKAYRREHDLAMITLKELLTGKLR